jgi:hypothetical protein
MTVADVLNRAREMGAAERLMRHNSECSVHGWCRPEPLDHETFGWTSCRTCLTLFDSYGVPVNPVAEMTMPTPRIVM